MPARAPGRSESEFSLPEQSTQPGLRTWARTCARGGGALGAALATLAALRQRDVAEHLLDVLAAAGEGRTPALRTVDAPAHQGAPPALTARGSAVSVSASSRRTSSM